MFAGIYEKNLVDFLERSFFARIFSLTERILIDIILKCCAHAAQEDFMRK